jgi:hypothetical protein
VPPTQAAEASPKTVGATLSDRGPYIEGNPLRLRVGTGWTEVLITSEVRVIHTRRGYVPVLEIERQHLPHILFVSAASLADPLEKIRASRGGVLAGARIRLHKTGEDHFSSYEIELLETSP